MSVGRAVGVSPGDVDRRRALRGLGAALLAFLGLGVLTDLLATPLFTRMVPRTPLDFLFLTTTSLLTGAYVYATGVGVDGPAQGAGAEAARSDDDARPDAPGPDDDTRPDATCDACATGGALGGAFAFACPVCNHLLLALASSSAVMTYVDPLRPAVGALSTAVLGWAVWRAA